MKKLLGIIILGLLWCNIGFADYYAISKSKTNKTRSAQSASLPTKERAKEVALNMCLSSFGNKETCYIESVNFTEVKVKGGYDIELRAKYDEDLKKLFENSSNYSCADDLDWSATYSSNEEYLNYTFKNINDNFIKISKFGLLSKNEKFMAEGDGFILKPFGLVKRSLNVKNLNLDVAGNSTMFCSLASADTKILKKSKNTNNMNVAPPRTDNFRTWHIFAAIGVFFILAILYDVVTNKNRSPQKNKIKKNKVSDFDSGYKEGSNFIETVWNGQETMAKTFWIYCILFVAIISFVAGILSASQGAFVFIIPAIVIIWSNTGLWRSSNIYQNQRLKSQQSYGWATVAKTYVVLNYLTTLSQLGFILKGF